MRTRSRFAHLLIASLLWLFATAASAATPRIGVMTMQPGEIFFERFGHNAIVVDDPDAPAPLSYNFGFFDPGEPGFVWRFVKGDMRYLLAVLPMSDDLVYYREVGRGVSIQWLDLTPAQARGLADALAFNARPENARYRYEYFTDNCSTRVRDALDKALGGTLRKQLEGRSTGDTFRSESVRLASPATWMWLGFDIGLGPYADRPLSRWEDAFVPMRLAESLREAKNTEGRPLVREESLLLAHRPRVLGAVALPFWTVLGLLACVMAFLWCCTAHIAGWENRNLLVFSPLCLLLLPGAWALLRGRSTSRLHQWVRVAIVLGGVLACFLQLPATTQFQAPWIALLLPLHAALAFPARRT